MSKKYTAPGIYIQEIKYLPPTVVQVETAIPAFIGYTEKAERHGMSVVNQPIRISSLLEFNTHFGAEFSPKFELVSKLQNDPRPIFLNGEAKSLQIQPKQRAFLYQSVRDYFSNSGRACFIIAVGTYGGKDSLEIKKEELLGTSTSAGVNLINGGLKALENITEPSILLIPDAVGLSGEDCHEVYRAMLNHCGVQRNRFSIFDIHNGYQTERARISNFRNLIGTQHLSYGAAYYPWLDRFPNQIEVSFKNLDPAINLLEIIPEVKALEFLSVNPMPAGENLHQRLLELSPTYVEILQVIQENLKPTPSIGAVAGAYSNTDTTRGVWRPPANVAIKGFEKPSVNISDLEQQNLNIDSSSGKSINAIRTFKGKRMLIWGARTLAGNDNEWRYVPVRRTCIMIEQSVQNSLHQFVFEPNDANTWSRIGSATETFLFQFWRQGCLLGSKPEEAFFVGIGLGKTMTSMDILEGRMIMEIGLAIVRPAEFIILRISQKMNKS